MMQPIDPASSVLAEDQLAAMGDADLAALISARRGVLAESERAFTLARDRFDRDRKALRLLEAEEERRRLVAAGESAAPVEVRPRKRRSTTGMDALLGRDGIDPDAPFDHFHFLSLQRQEILLNHAGDAGAQALAFVDRHTGTLREAHTFGQARKLYEEQHQLGRPGIPLQRQAIWYIAEGRAGWLRLDQMFVEQESE